MLNLVNFPAHVHESCFVSLNYPLPTVIPNVCGSFSSYLPFPLSWNELISGYLVSPFSGKVSLSFSRDRFGNKIAKFGKIHGDYIMEPQKVRINIP